MYDIPQDVDWSFMVGKDLLQVCYGKYQTQLRFEGAVSISIEGNIEHRNRDTLLRRSEQREQGVMSLLSLLGASIDRVIVGKGNSLILAFSNEHVLTLLSDESPYEAFSISAPGQTIIV